MAAKRKGAPKFRKDPTVGAGRAKVGGSSGGGGPKMGSNKGVNLSKSAVGNNQRRDRKGRFA